MAFRLSTESRRVVKVVRQHVAAIVNAIVRTKNPYQIEGARQGRASDGVRQASVRFANVRYRRLNKNAHRLIVTGALADLPAAAAKGPERRTATPRGTRPSGRRDLSISPGWRGLDRGVQTL
jgi:hypothetical protein